MKKLSHNTPAKVKLNAVLTEVINRLEKAEAFVLDQAPGVCQEVVKEKLILASLNAAWSGPVTAACAYLTYWVSANHSQYGCGPVAVATGALGLGSGLYFFCCLNELASAKVAPKLTILRELKSLVSGKVSS